MHPERGRIDHVLEASERKSAAAKNKKRSRPLPSTCASKDELDEIASVRFKGVSSALEPIDEDRFFSFVVEQGWTQSP